MRSKSFGLVMLWLLTAVLFFIAATYNRSKLPESESHAWTETCNWIGATGGTWSTGSNWDCNGTNRVPTATDQVIIDANVTVNISATTTIDDLVLGNAGGTSTPILNFTYDAITNGALIIDDSNAIIYTNSSVTHTVGTTVVVGKAYINVQTGNLTVNGAINLDAKGYAASEGTGQGTNGNGSGGAGYGGEGGNDAFAGIAGGITYGSLTNPTDLGSGGGIDGVGAKGGGAIKINVGGTLTVSGTISAKGEINPGTASSDAGGGSGGTVNISTVTLEGAGTISVNGSDGYRYGGAGGGGRIAVAYTTDNSTITYQAFGGAIGNAGGNIAASGTIYFKPTSGDGRVVLDNTNRNPGQKRSADLPASISLTTLDIKNYARISLGTATTITTINLNTNGILQIDAGASTTYTTFNWTGASTLVDRGGTFALLSSAGDITVPTSATLIADTVRTYVNVTVNGVVTHTGNSTAETYKLSQIATGDYTVSASGSINVNEKGFSPAYGTGKGTNGNGAGGGGYGGEGGDGNGAGGGVTYGSTTQPNNIGSGGGLDGTGLYVGGGGAIKLDVAGTLTVSGPISANGGTSFTGTSDVGSGSGGSIWLISGTLAGASTISANGGLGGVSGQYSGSGGGGRIALYYATDSSSTTVTAKSGGTNGVSWVTGGAGTVYREITAGAKSVTIDNGNLENNDNFTKISTGLSLTTLTVNNKGSLWVDISNTSTTINLTNSGKLLIDSAANVTYTTLNWATSGILVDRGGTFALLSSGGSLTVPATTYLYADTTRSYTDVTVNGILSTSSNSTTELYKINHTTSGNFTISGTGSINVEGKGFAGGYGTGKGTNGNGSGGAGYGGEGGNDALTNIAGGITYGSLTNPTDIGSGGGINDGGSMNGGGAVRLIVGGTLTVSGTINVNGETNTCTSTDDCGGGSGGSVSITADTLAGNSTVSANGTNAYRYGGAGGGGRIAINYITDSSTVTYQAFGGALGSLGGNIAAAGTVYLNQSGGSKKVIVSNTNRNAGAKKTASLPAGTSVDELTVKDYGRIHLSTDAITVTTVYLNTDGVLQNESGAVTTTTTLTWTGTSTLIDRGGTFAPLSGGGALSIPSSAYLYADTARSFSSITVNGTLTTTSNTTTETYELAYTVSSDVTISAGGKIDVSGKGYTSSEGSGQGVDAATGSGGGAYGGNGGAGVGGAGGTAYGSSTAPSNIGSGGGAEGVGNGGAGGGNVTMNITGTLTVTGSILADGGAYALNDSGGGAGGTININAGTVAGSGNIYARGGIGKPGTSGGGGGGRIALFYTGWSWSGNTLTDAAATSGGTGYAAGSIGSVYLESTNQLPTTSGVTINAGSSAINLTAGSSINVSCTATITDLDGYLDISSVSANLYRTSLGSGAADSDSTHYTVSCSGGSGSGTTQPYTCTFPVWFIAEATDTGSSYPSDDWSCKVTPFDSDGEGANDTDTIEMNSLSAISVSPSAIDFDGVLTAGGNSGATNDTTEFLNIGNVAIDVEISGTSLCLDYPTCSGVTIPVGNIEYKDTSFTYNGGIDLTSSPVFNGYNIAKSTVHPSNQSRTTYWGVGIPLSVTSGTYTGAALFTALRH